MRMMSDVRCEMLDVRTQRLPALVTLAAVVLLALLPVGCEEPDTSYPTVRWVYPADGDTVDPGVHELVTVATDDREVRRVFFFVYSEMLGIVDRLDSDTFRLKVDCIADTLPVYRLFASAEDFGGNMTQEDVTVYVRRKGGNEKR